MRPRLELPDAPDPGLSQLQNALNDLEEIAHAFQNWTGDPGTSPVELFAGREADESKRIEMIVDLAEFLRNRGDASPSHDGFGAGSSKPEPVRPRFEVVRHLASGGLGQVSVAIDHELKREVALKQILGRHADDPSRRDRFQIEAEITGGLEHPGIVPVYSLGHSADGRPYYAMRLIQGETLADAISRFHHSSFEGHPGGWGLELRKLLRRFIDVCNAIEYAHGRGILHRDLKPSNVMLGNHGETLVLDWGLARSIETSAEGELDHNELFHDATVGTPAFMSPEQATGGRTPVGPRSDVYSLGATLYCLLTGQPPFRATEPGRILADVRAGNFPRPQRVNSRVPRPLESIALKAMNLDPADRYGSSRELADDIERWSANEPISTASETCLPRLGCWARRHWRLVSASLVMAIVLLSLVLFSRPNIDHQVLKANQEPKPVNQWSRIAKFFPTV